MLVFTVGPRILNFHSESKFTGNIQTVDGTGCKLENVVSQYAFVTGTGFNINLHLVEVEQGGACTVGTVDDAFSLLLPTFIFSTSSLAAVGGVVMSASTFAMLAPWVAVIGILGCAVMVVAFHRAGCHLSPR